MTNPTPEAPRPRSMLPWILGGCALLVIVGGCLGLFGLGVLGALLSGEEVASSPDGAPGAPGAPAEAPSGPDRPVGVYTNITTADLVGEWAYGTSSSFTYVDPGSGAYRGSSVSGYSVRYVLAADGTFTSKFQGLNNGTVSTSAKKGTWALAGSKLVLTPDDGPAEGYWFLSYEVKPAGVSNLVLLSDRYPVSDGNGIYKETWVRGG